MALSDNEKEHLGKVIELALGVYQLRNTQKAINDFLTALAEIDETSEVASNRRTRQSLLAAAVQGYDQFRQTMREFAEL